MNTRIEQRLSEELAASPAQVRAAVALLDEGATVPFIARYRKEATGGLDDTQLRTLEERLAYLRELEDRRAAVLESIASQGKLDAALEAAIQAADSKQRLEDLYAPYKPRRRTKAQIAREAGLAPLAESLLADPTIDPQQAATRYLNPEAGFADEKAVLEGARHILVETFAEDATLIGRLREHLQAHAHVRSQVIPGKETEGAKFRDWFDFSESLATMPSHRALALLRGRNEGILHIALVLPGFEDETAADQPHPCVGIIAQHNHIRQQNRPADPWLADTARWAWRTKIADMLETEQITALRERADHDAIRIFSKNLKDLLLAAPAGSRATMGLDPGIRTGVKVAVVDPSGKVLDTATIYPFEPKRDRDGSLATLARLVRAHGVELIAIGNGTASRETDALAAELLKLLADAGNGKVPTKVTVSEAGASVYSASELAARELPDLDVSLRGAVSIARRLQDPLAELVKIEARAIGVGQYQHDVNQTRLAKSLEAVVEDCVNAVGIDLNTASVPLLARISGLTRTLAENIVAHRDQHGPFPNRAALRNVPRLGPKAFEQCAGFLRIRGGDQPLDASAVHPEAYPVVERILARVQQTVPALLGNHNLLARLNPADFTDDRFGLPTVTDILAELEKPGRDPRPEFRTAQFREGIETLADLAPGMTLEGTVTNVTAFGAFVDIGVHQDGLVHISALADRFVKDPHSVVKAGDVVRVKVLEVDIPRKRIALTMRLGDTPAPRARDHSAPNHRPARPHNTGGGKPAPQTGNALADAFARARRK